MQPRRVECLVSNDGKAFRLLAASVIDVPIERDAKDLSVKPCILRHKPNQSNAGNHARYVKLRAESPGALPATHPGRRRQSLVCLLNHLVYSITHKAAKILTL